MRPSAKQNPWVKAKKYAGGGQVDPDEEDSGDFPPPASEDQDEGQAATTQPASDTQGPPTQTNAPRTPASTKDNVLNIRDQLQQYLAKQGAGSDKMQQLADLYKDQLSQQGQRSNLSPMMALADHYFGTNLSKAYTPPPTDVQQTKENMGAQEAVQKVTQPVTQDLLREYGNDTNASTKAQANYYNFLYRQNRQTASDQKSDAKLDTDSLKDLTHQKEYQAAQSQMLKAPGLLNTIDLATFNGPQDPGNQLAREALATELGVYISGGQRLHTSTVQAMGFKGVGALKTRINQVMQELSTGTLSPENANFAKEFITHSKMSAANELNEMKNGASTDFESIHGRKPRWAPVATQSPAQEAAAPPQAPVPPSTNGIPAPTGVGVVAKGVQGIPDGSVGKIIKNTGQKIWLTPDNKRLPRQ